MLSYRHAYHAGNHADVLKHLAEVLILDYLRKKADKPLRYIDTHAGPGLYDLAEGYARQNSEFESGISRLWQAPDLPEPLSRYVNTVRSFNPGSELTRYPGSPAIARAMLGAKHKLQLFELHPADFEQLQKWGRGDRRVSAEKLDGFQRLPKSLPPHERRALVVIDPPYELKQDYQAAVAALESAVRQFASGVYLLWYPLLQRDEVGRMLKRLRGRDWHWLNAELCVGAASSGGMYGSGVFVINPPWHLMDELRASLPVLQRLLGDGNEQEFSLTGGGEG
ncbi:MAG: 23S rRNA (adenine(2030)-N(6))-methyltransferase RlmJ [Gammaproteobacteria bacterium]|nr:23S rRNA (adenine(2030)-N(6))-methyltransferase RlmJ [Gammaproteobacteria bacterium]